MDKAAPVSARTPDATTRDALDGELLLGEDAAPVAEFEGDAAADAPTPAKTGPLSVSCGSFDPIAIAAAWKFVNVLPEAGALMAPTIPRPQCCTCLQWNQIGLVSSVMVIENCTAC